MTINEFVDQNIILNVSMLMEYIDVRNTPESMHRLFESSEQWVVSEYLGRQLKAKGEMIESFAGHHVWGRRNQGQPIAMDKVIQNIYREVQDVNECREWYVTTILLLKNVDDKKKLEILNCFTFSIDQDEAINDSIASGQIIEFIKQGYIVGQYSSIKVPSEIFDKEVNNAN